MYKLISSLILVTISLTAFSQNGQVTTTTGTAENLYYKDGNVGIGTTSPDKQLTLRTDEFIGWKYQPGYDCFHTITAGGLNPMSFTVNPFSANTPVFQFNGNKGTILSMLNGGNIGIGINNPTANLDIESPALGGGETLLRFQVSDASNDYLLINNATGANGQFIPGIHSHHASDNRQALYITGSIPQTNDVGIEPITIFDSRIINSSVTTRPLFAWDSYGQRKMILTANGNVGIGTPAPNHKLSVYGGNISISNGENSTIYSSAHNLYFSGPDNGYAHKVYTFRPAWGTPGSTFSCLAIQTADTQGNFTTKTLLHSSGTSYFMGGNVGIGTKDTKEFKLAVNGKIGADEIQVKANYWSDFVFEDDYKLKDLEEVESYIEENKHLPDVPSEKEVLENGIQLGEMDAKLLQKIEELTLYMIEQNKMMKDQNKEIQHLKNEIKILKIYKHQ